MIATNNYYIDPYAPTGSSYTIIQTDVSSSNYASVSLSVECNHYPPMDLHEVFPALWHAPKCAGQVDPLKDKPNVPVKHNNIRSIAPIHFRSYRAQVCRGK